MEAEIVKELLKYGVLGVMLAYFVLKDSKKTDKTNEILEKIEKVYSESIAHERGNNEKEKANTKECYEKLVGKMEKVDSSVCDIGQKLDIYIETKRT